MATERADARLTAEEAADAAVFVDSNTTDLTTILGEFTDYLKAEHINTLAELNAIISDATLIDSGDSRLSDDRTPTAHSHTASDVSDFDTEVANNSAVAANTDKITNATHTGDATGSGALSVVALRGVSLDSTVGTPSNGEILVYRSAGSDWVLEAKPAGGSTPAWGDITGTLASQSDLQSALDAKEDTITDSDDINEGAANLFLTTTERSKLTNTPADTNASLAAKAPLLTTIENKSSDDTLTDADAGTTFIITADGVDLTLPASDTSAGWFVVIQNEGAYDTTWPVNSNTVNGPTSMGKEGSVVVIMRTAANTYRVLGGDPGVAIALACGAHGTDLVAGTDVMSYEFDTNESIKLWTVSVDVAPTGAALQIDINKNGTSIFSTVLSIDATETSSLTAATAAVITTEDWAAGDILTVDIDQIGSTLAGQMPIIKGYY